MPENSTSPAAAIPALEATPGHIASMVLWLVGSESEILRRLGEQSWLEFPLPTEQGKCVALLEEVSERALIGRIDWLREQPEVVNAQLVYHFNEEPGT